MTAGEQAGAIAPGILWVAVEEALLERELVGHAVAAGDAVHRAREFEGDRARDRADYELQDVRVLLRANVRRARDRRRRERAELHPALLHRPG